MTHSTRRLLFLSISLGLAVGVGTPTRTAAAFTGDRFTRRVQLFPTYIPGDSGQVRPAAKNAAFGRLRGKRRHQPWLTGEGLALTPDERVLVTTAPNNDTVAFIDAKTMLKLGEVVVTGRPERVVVDKRGQAFVTTRLGRQLVVIDILKRAVTKRLYAGVEPYGVALSADRRTVYVTAGASQELFAFDTQTLKQRYRVPIRTPWPGLITAHPYNGSLYVGHLRPMTKAEISVFKASDGATRGRLTLPTADSGPGRHHRRNAKAQATQHRTPGRVSAIRVAGNGRRLYVAHAANRLGKPTASGAGYGSGASEPVSFALTTFDLATRRPLKTRVPLSSFRPKKNKRTAVQHAIRQMRGLSQPAALLHHPRWGSIIAAYRASGDILGYDVSAASLLDRPVWQKKAEGAPSAMAITADGLTLFIKTDLAFTVLRRPVGRDGAAPIGPQWEPKKRSETPYARDRLPKTARRGRELFHTSTDGLSRRGVTCSNCHPDGRTDGMTWTVDGGFRQTPLLTGRLTELPGLHANVVRTVQRLGGAGLKRLEVDSLITYVTLHLPGLDNPNLDTAFVGAQPPTTANNVRENAVELGRTLFNDTKVGCVTCHLPNRDFSDGLTHDVGTMTPTERAATKTTTDAKRRGLSLGYPTPSLRGLWASAPYFHDGSSPTLKSLLLRGDNMGNVSHLSDTDRAALVTYLRTL